jgi:predicted Fe-Mo cluster-binding NifX family protein
MKICMPVDQLNGLDSEIAPNFRAAPTLLVIDSVNGECLGIDASSGACHATPQHIDAIVCAGGIGRGMFNGLRSRGIQVFNTDAMTVKEALAELAAGRLTAVAEVECCGGGHHGEANAHARGHDCACGTASGESENSGCACSHH